MLSTPLVEAIEFQQCAVAKFLPLLDAFKKGGLHRRSPFDDCQVDSEFLESQSKREFSTSAFAFENVAGAFRQATAGTIGVALVASKKFAMTNTTKSGSVLDEPALPAKRELCHGHFTGAPIDRRDESWSEAVFGVPTGLGAFGESTKSAKLFPVDLRQLFVGHP